MDYHGHFSVSWIGHPEAEIKQVSIVSKLNGKHVVIGLGKTGLSCVRFLKRLECDVVVIDTREMPPGKEELANEFPEVSVYTGTLEKFDLTQAQELIVSPGISIKSKSIADAQAAGVSVAGDVELFARSVDAPVIAVTGSNGKSTVVTLIGKALETTDLKVCVAGNIGLPVLDALSTYHDVDVWVLELSSFQLETTHSLRAKVAVNLNVSDDHMDRYDSLDDYATAKQRIFEGSDSAVYWLDDYRTKPVQPHVNQNPFGGDTELHGRFYVNTEAGVPCVMDGSKAVLYANDLLVKGKHNLLNVAAALTVLVEFGLDYKAALFAIKSFPGLPHRCQWIANVKGANWYNDSKGTNIGSTVAAIEGLSADKKSALIWIAGGEGKGADFSQLKDSVSKNVSMAILFGRDAVLMKQALENGVNIQLVGTLAEAVALAHQQAANDDVVLMSPACASFDQFKSFEDRGNRFVELVRALG